MKFKVHMLAFCDKGTVREVDVPEEALPTNQPAHVLTTVILELIFHYGQNEFQPKNMPSVSVGDVIQGGSQKPRYFEVAMAGFKEIPKKKFDKLEGKRTQRMDIPW